MLSDYSENSGRVRRTPMETPDYQLVVGELGSYESTTDE